MAASLDGCLHVFKYSIYTDEFMLHHNYAPNFEEVEGTIGLGLSVQSSPVQSSGVQSVMRE